MEIASQEETEIVQIEEREANSCNNIKTNRVG
jgi:hypothetical protein